MGLDELRDEQGLFRVLAVDHRDSLRLFIEPTAPEMVPDQMLTDIKAALVRAVSPFATGVMLEPEYSIPQLLEDRSVADGVGVIAALESQGYLADPGAAPTTVLENWSAERAAASGAAAAKLLLPYHPHRPLAEAQRAVAADVLAACRRVDLPLVLEPLFYDVHEPSERAAVVLTTVEHFASTGADLLKLPFPVDPAAVTDHSARVEACCAVTERCEQPWAILSGGGGFDVFDEQVAAAVEAGGSGFMVGRALWGEAARCSASNRHDVITETVLPRWHRLTDTSERAFAARPPT